MIAQIGAELRKVVTTRLWWVLAICAFGYVGVTSGVMAFVVGSLIDQTGVGFMFTNTQLAGIVFSTATSVGYVFPLILGCVMTTAEFRSNTIVPTFLAQPKRGIVLTGKAIAAGVFGLVFGLIVLASSVIPGGIMLAIWYPDVLADTSILMLLRIVIALAVWCVIGVGLGALLKSQVAAIVVALVFTQFIEPLLRTFSSLLPWATGVGKFLPGAVTDGFVGASLYTTLGQDPSSEALVFDWWLGGLLLLAYAVLFLVIARATTWRRDIA